MQLYVDGRFVVRGEARVSVGDAGLQHGVGLFETMAAFNGEVFRLEQHLDRLRESAVELGLTRQFDAERLRQAVVQTIAKNGLDRARVRLTLTGGPTSLLAPAAEKSGSPEPTVLIEVTEPTAYDPGYFEEGISVIVGPSAANPFDPMAGHKTLAYWARLRTLRQAAAAGAGEAIWLNVTRHLASGSVSNLFLVKDGEVLTPFARGEEVSGAMPAPVLPGVTRAAVIELAEVGGVTVHRRMLDINDLLGADEVFLTNSSWQVLPVTRVEKSVVAEGAVGAITQRLRAGLLEVIDRETGGCAG